MNKIILPLVFTLSALTPVAFADVNSATWQKARQEGQEFFKTELGHVHTCDDAVAQKIVVCMNFADPNSRSERPLNSH